MSESVRFCPTSLDSLDHLLGGGIGLSPITHLYGIEGEERTTLLAQITASLVFHGKKVLFASTGEFSPILDEYHLRSRPDLFAFVKISSLTAFETVATKVEQADFIILDGTTVSYDPGVQAELERTHSKDKAQTFGQLMLAGLAFIVRAAAKHDKRLVICSFDPRLAGPGLGPVGLPSHHLMEVQGIASTIIELIPRDQYYIRSTHIPQEIVVHRHHRITALTSRPLVLGYNSKPHYYVDLPQETIYLVLNEDGVYCVEATDSTL